jgi:DNA polymerase
MDTLEEVDTLVRSCTDCPLHSGRTNAVPGEGPADAELLFIGEGPGYQEDRQGRPFVGPAGGFLEDLLQSVGMTRDQVYIANMVKCRPPDNRDPTPGEIAACSKYLDRQIELIDPRLIVTLGRFSTSRFLPGQSISRVRGRLRTVDGRQIFPIMHPAAGLRRQEMRAAIEEDFQKLAGLLDVLRMDAEPASADGGIRETPAAYATDPEPPAIAPSFWDLPAPQPTDDGPENDDGPETLDPPAPPEEPPPGQQRLF